MRSIRDHRLPPPFDEWIDRSVPLPKNVLLLPRVVGIANQLFVLFYIGGGLTAFVVLVLINFGEDAAKEGGGKLLFLCCFLAIPLTILFLMLRSLLLAFGAWRDERRGVLRQGILMGPAGILVRLEKNDCYPIRLEEYIATKVVTRKGRYNLHYIEIETTNGPVLISPEWAPVSPDFLETFVRDMRKGGTARNNAVGGTSFAE